ncbi:hypothetical protein [Kroppenstedtia sanguinis]|uniref:Uncharacterized protein n=1 Tax=Kroppenstedtia sanguinis TaxID=1380684 RepID=A0ABW4CEE6_9BACL
MLTYENRCHLCGEDRVEHVVIKDSVAHCQICGCRYRLVEEQEETDWEELMGAKESA